MIDEKRFATELYEEFLGKHPELENAPHFKKLLHIAADFCAAVVTKYDRERSDKP